jgi:hypothetical protein
MTPRDVWRKDFRAHVERRKMRFEMEKVMIYNKTHPLTEDELEWARNAIKEYEALNNGNN